MKLSPKEHNLDDVFRDRLKDLKIQPSELAWFGIEANLPARSVFYSPLRVVSGIAAVVAVVSFGIVASVGNLSNRTALTAQTAAISLPEFIAPDSEITSSLVEEITAITPLATSIASTSVATVASGPAESSASTEELFVAPRGTDAIPTVQPEIQPELANLALKPVNEKDFRGFRVGGILGANNTWLFTNTENNRSSVVTGYRPTIGSSFGFSVGYDFSAGTAVEVDIIASSSEGQIYKLMTEEGPVTAHAKVNYTRIPVFFKKRFTSQSGLLNTPVSVSYLAGVQYGSLNWVNLEKDAEFLKESAFNKQELGITFGLEYDIYFAKNYALTFGARAAVNNEINTFPFFMSDEYVETANFSLGAQVKLSYLLR